MRIAALGCGSIGRRHLRNLHSLGYTDLLAFDPILSVREAVSNELGIQSVGTLEQVWAQAPDVVLITAPSNLHVSLALSAARHGCHLFIEKPLSHSLDGLYALEKEVKQHKLVTMVACNMRFHPGPAMVKKLIEEKAVGKVIASRIQTGSYLPNWRPWQDYRQSYSASPEWGGAIFDCIHEIDLALWYFGQAKVLGSAYLSAKQIGLETDGVAEIILQHHSGILSNVHLNFVQRDYRRTCQVIGAEGTIYWNESSHEVRVYGKDGKLSDSVSQPDSWEDNQMYVDELVHFLQAVQERTQTGNPLLGGLSALQIALTVRESSLKED